MGFWVVAPPRFFDDAGAELSPIRYSVHRVAGPIAYAAGGFSVNLSASFRRILSVAALRVLDAGGATVATHDFKPHEAGGDLFSVGKFRVKPYRGADATPAGSISAVSAGTPAGSLSSDSAGTPAGSISAVSAGTPAGTVSSTFSGDVLASHTHTFTGNAMGNHTHTPTTDADTLKASGAASNATVNDGVACIATCNTAHHASQANVVVASGVAKVAAMTAIAAASAGTPTGSNVAASAGTPSGSVASTFTGSALATHTHTFTGSALATHTHTFTGSALATHTHTFTGSPLATHTHTFTGAAQTVPFGELPAGTNLSALTYEVAVCGVPA
jgi:hypothetical protein